VVPGETGQENQARRGLKQIQYQSDLADRCPAEVDLITDG